MGFAIKLSDAVANKTVLDADAFTAGLSYIIDGVVICMNASVWTKARVAGIEAVMRNRIIGLMTANPLVGVVMGSKSDYGCMGAAVRTLREFEIAYEARVVSAHRTPDLLWTYASEARGRGLRVIIAGAGGAAHLPGMLAAKTIVPVFGVPVNASALNGLDSLLSIVQMPRGVPVGTLSIGEAGAVNAALLAVAVLATTDPGLADKLEAWRRTREQSVLAEVIGETK